MSAGAGTTDMDGRASDGGDGARSNADVGRNGAYHVREGFGGDRNDGIASRDRAGAETEQEGQQRPHRRLVRRGPPTRPPHEVEYVRNEPPSASEVSGELHYAGQPQAQGGGMRELADDSDPSSDTALGGNERQRNAPPLPMPPSSYAVPPTNPTGSWQSPLPYPQPYSMVQTYLLPTGQPAPQPQVPYATHVIPTNQPMQAMPPFTHQGPTREDGRFAATAAPLVHQRHLHQEQQYHHNRPREHHHHHHHHHPHHDDYQGHRNHQRHQHHGQRQHHKHHSYEHGSHLSHHSRGRSQPRSETLELDSQYPQDHHSEHGLMAHGAAVHASRDHQRPPPSSASSVAYTQPHERFPTSAAAPHMPPATEPAESISDARGHLNGQNYNYPSDGHDYGGGSAGMDPYMDPSAEQPDGLAEVGGLMGNRNRSTLSTRPVPPCDPGEPIQFGVQERGPPGANLFVFHLPNDMTTWELYALFRRFGEIRSTCIVVDKRTHRTKGYGFVSFDKAAYARAALQNMNGFSLGRKRLKVEYKKGEEPMYHDHGAHTIQRSPGGGSAGLGVIHSRPLSAAAPPVAAPLDRGRHARGSSHTADADSLASDPYVERPLGPQAAADAHTPTSTTTATTALHPPNSASSSPHPEHDSGQHIPHRVRSPLAPSSVDAVSVAAAKQEPDTEEGGEDTAHRVHVRLDLGIVEGNHGPGPRKSKGRAAPRDLIRTASSSSTPNSAHLMEPQPGKRSRPLFTVSNRHGEREERDVNDTETAKTLVMMRSYDAGDRPTERYDPPTADQASHTPSATTSSIDPPSTGREPPTSNQKFHSVASPAGHEIAESADPGPSDHEAPPR